MIQKNENFYMGKKLGQEAFQNGYSCNPEHDLELKNLYKGKSSEAEKDCKVGWLNGWRGELLNTGDW
jgi:hypothetical protein